MGQGQNWQWPDLRRRAATAPFQGVGWKANERKFMMRVRGSIGAVRLLILVLFCGVLAGAQDAKAATNAAAAASPSQADSSAGQGSAQQGSAQEWSGMYSFLKEGEFVQLTVEEQGEVTGFISRYSDGNGDKGVFVDQFFKSAKLEGNKLSFTTEAAKGEWFAFKGTIERGAGKNPGDEGYYALKGALTRNTTDANKKVTAQSHDVALNMFPQEAAAGPVQGSPEPRN
jgi:hypothetical protein